MWDGAESKSSILGLFVAPKQDAAERARWGPAQGRAGAVGLSEPGFFNTTRRTRPKTWGASTCLRWPSRAWGKGSDAASDGRAASQQAGIAAQANSISLGPPLARSRR